MSARRRGAWRLHRRRSGAPPTVTALADRLGEDLARGRLARVGPVDLGPEGFLPDAELAARVVLADVDHRAYMERAGRRASRVTWEHLAEQLRRLLANAART